MTTDQTVPVPVSLLQEIEDEVYYHSDSPLVRLREFIPTLPKVGDTLTAKQVAALPIKAVVVDFDEDAWSVVVGGMVTMTGEAETFAPLQAYAPYTLVYLPGV